MKIGINARTFSASEPGGAVQTAVELTRQLVEHGEHEIRIFGHRDAVEQFGSGVRGRSTGYVLDSQVFGILWERSVLPALALVEDLDVLLCPNGNAPPLPIPGCRVVMYIHDVNALKGMSSGAHRLYRRLMVPLGARFADRILTVSEFSKSEICGTLSVSPEKVRVVYNGLDDVFFDSDAGEPFDLPERYVLYVGAMNPRKNVGTLIETFQRLKREEGIPQKLVLVGPKNKRVFKKLAIDRSSDDVVVTGFVTQKQLKYAYENADLFVYPSLYEGFGLPPLEAMACRTPTIASNSSSLPEVLGSAAELVDPYDPDELYEAMRRVLTDATLRASLEREGRERAEEFTWERSLQQLLEGLDPE